MKLEDLHTEIANDSVIDELALDVEALKISQLQSKYMRLFMDELFLLKGYESDYRVKRRERFEFYTGKASDEVYEKERLNHKILIKDADMYIDSDPEISRLRLRVDIQKAKTEMIEAFLKSLNNRNYQIRSAIDWRKFQHGG